MPRMHWNAFVADMICSRAGFPSKVSLFTLISAEIHQDHFRAFGKASPRSAVEVKRKNRKYENKPCLSCLSCFPIGDFQYARGLWQCFPVKGGLRISIMRRFAVLVKNNVKRSLGRNGKRLRLPTHTCGTVVVTSSIVETLVDFPAEHFKIQEDGSAAHSSNTCGVQMRTSCSDRGIEMTDSRGLARSQRHSGCRLDLQILLLASQNSVQSFSHVLILTVFC